MTRIDPRFVDLGPSPRRRRPTSRSIAAIAPDVVFAAARSEWIASPSRRSAMPVVAFDGESKAQLRDAMRLAGALFGPDARRAPRPGSPTSTTCGPGRRGDSRPSPSCRGSCSPARSGRASRAAPCTSPSSIEAAGGRPSAPTWGYWNDVGVEQVLAWDPEVVLVPPYGQASVAAVLDDPRVAPAPPSGRRRPPRAQARRPVGHARPRLGAGVVWLTELAAPRPDRPLLRRRGAFFYRALLRLRDRRRGGRRLVPALTIAPRASLRRWGPRVLAPSASRSGSSRRSCWRSSR
jgi:hypothetical protein